MLPVNTLIIRENLNVEMPGCLQQRICAALCCLKLAIEGGEIVGPVSFKELILVVVELEECLVDPVVRPIINLEKGPKKQKSKTDWDNG